MINEQFLTNWKVEFELVLRETIAYAMGYTPEGLSILKSPTPEDEAAWAMAQYETLDKLQRSFISSCKKSGMLNRFLQKEKDWRDYDYVGEGLSEWHPYVKDIPQEVIEGSRKFNLFLAAWVKKSKMQMTHAKKQIHRRRARIPTKIAFEIARAIEFFNGNRKALDSFRKLTLPKNYFELILRKTVSDVKRQIVSAIKTELEPKLIEKETAKSPRRIHQLNISIRRAQEELQEVHGFEIKWVLARNRGNLTDTRWVNHFKNHLLKIVLSHGKPKIIRKLKPFNANLNKVIKKMRQRNQETLRIQQ